VTGIRLDQQLKVAIWRERIFVMGDEPDDVIAVTPFLCKVGAELRMASQDPESGASTGRSRPGLEMIEKFRPDRLDKDLGNPVVKAN
jgi:hypothetical protein